MSEIIGPEDPLSGALAHAPEPKTELTFPCSQAQEQFWLLDRLSPGDPSLNVAVRWQLDGAVSVDILEKAFHRILLRHEILRTAFVETDSEPTQHVCELDSFKVSEIDLTALPEADRMDEALRIGRLEASAPFDLTVAPLLRVTLLRLGDARSMLLVTAHHIICDGWSIGILAREMGEVYRAIQTHHAPPLADLPVQYGDYALWQREWLKSGALRPQTEYWLAKLAGLKHFEVATDFPRPPVQTANGHIGSVVLPRALTDRLQACSQHHGCTLFMTALAALKTLLHRCTGETDITVGTQVARRGDVELEPMVGLFVNTLVLRDDLSNDPLFSDLLDRVRDTVLGALAHADMPMQSLVEQLKPERDLSRNPLFSVNSSSSARSSPTRTTATSR